MLDKLKDTAGNYLEKAKAAAEKHLLEAISSELAEKIKDRYTDSMALSKEMFKTLDALYKEYLPNHWDKNEVTYVKDSFKPIEFEKRGVTYKGHVLLEVDDDKQYAYGESENGDKLFVSILDGHVIHDIGHPNNTEFKETTGMKYRRSISDTMIRTHVDASNEFFDQITKVPALKKIQEDYNERLKLAMGLHRGLKEYIADVYPYQRQAITDGSLPEMTFNRDGSAYTGRILYDSDNIKYVHANIDGSGCIVLLYCDDTVYIVRNVDAE